MLASSLLVPETVRFLLLPVNVTLSELPFPKTALPIMDKSCAPLTVSLKLTVEAVRLVLAPKATAPP